MTRSGTLSQCSSVCSIRDSPRSNLCYLATLIFDLGGHGACCWYRSSCSVCVPPLKFVGLPVRKILRTSGLSIIRPGDLDHWSLTLKLVRIIVRGIRNLLNNFDVSWTFYSRLMNQHLSDASRNLATLTLDLGGHGARWWCGSFCSISLPSLKFVGLLVRKILRTSGLSISRPGDLDLWPLTLKLAPSCAVVLCCCWLLNLLCKTRRMSTIDNPTVIEECKFMGDGSTSLLDSFLAKYQYHTKSRLWWVSIYSSIHWWVQLPINVMAVISTW